jgi:hypothetical protein
MCEVQARGGNVANDLGEDLDIAGDGTCLGGDRPAAQPEHGRDEPVMRLRADGLVEVLGVIDDRQAEHPRVGEGISQQLRALDRRAIVAEARDARIGELAERGEPLPCPARRRGPDLEQAHR